MKRWLGPALALIAAACITHAGVLYNAPTLIMSRAMTMLAEQGVPLHAFQVSERMTPQTQRVVRTSPDIAYSVCRYDLAKAPDGLRVSMGAYDGYSSLSFFAADTDNFLTVRGEGEARGITLLPPDVEAQGSGTAVSPSTVGVILIRRLAPTQAEYDRVVEAADDDECSVL